MSHVTRYIFRQLLWALSVTAVTLTCIVWLTQSLRFVELIVNRGLSAPIFIYMTFLLLPTFLGLILPIATFAAVLFTYHKLSMDSELVVLRAAGFGPAALARPVISMALIVMTVCYALSVYLVPASYREFKDMQFAVRNSYASVFLHEGVFNTVRDRITVFVRSRNAAGDLLGIIVHDSRNPNKPVTMMAERGAIVSGEAGPRVLMVNGSRQEVGESDGRLSLLYFDQYSFEIGNLNESPGLRWREPRERYLDELLYASNRAQEIWNFHKLRMEGHHRLASPLLAPSLALVALAFLLSGEFGRRSHAWRVIGAVTVGVAVEAALLGSKQIGERTPEVMPFIYLSSLVPALAASYTLFVGLTRRRSHRGAALLGARS